MNKVDIKLYGILDPERSLGRSLGDLAKPAALGGTTLLQYRSKNAETAVMLEEAATIKTALADTSVPLIINDRVDVALACNAEGVHLGPDDMPVKTARELLGPKAIIGLSIKTTEQALSAPLELIDYAFVGGVFETQSKDNPTAMGVHGWMEIANLIKNRAPNMPVGAIAGIDESNVQSLFAAGCDGIAMISALFMKEDVRAETAKFLQFIEGAEQ